MDAESFFSRWSRRKAESAPEGKTPQPPATELPAAESDVLSPAAAESNQAIKPPPTLDDVALLTPDSDYSPFVASGVDDKIKRLALKKLFADPHFNVMDGLDIYIDDYSKFEPIPPEMLASLNHAKALLDPLAQLDKPLSRLAQDIEEAVDATIHGESGQAIDSVDDGLAAQPAADTDTMAMAANADQRSEDEHQATPPAPPQHS